MTKSISLALFCLGVFARGASAYEYPLQFTPNAGFRNLVVAGYWFEGNEVVGTCSYNTVSGGSGKGGGHAPIAKRYSQTCRWSLYGDLLSITPGAPPAPAPLYSKGTQVVYAVNANGDYTGTDTKLPERGFVSTPGPHYTWLTPNNNAVVQAFVHTLAVMLKSDGDTPLSITAVVPSARSGTATVKSTSCVGQIDVGATCSIIVIYDPTKLTSATGLASDTLRIDLTSDAGEAHDFIQNFVVVLPKI